MFCRFDDTSLVNLISCWHFQCHFLACQYLFRYVLLPAIHTYRQTYLPNCDSCDTYMPCEGRVTQCTRPLYFCMERIWIFQPFKIRNQKNNYSRFSHPEDDFCQHTITARYEHLHFANETFDDGPYEINTDVPKTATGHETQNRLEREIQWLTDRNIRDVAEDECLRTRTLSLHRTFHGWGRTQETWGQAVCCAMDSDEFYTWCPDYVLNGLRVSIVLLSMIDLSNTIKIKN